MTVTEEPRQLALRLVQVTREAVGVHSFAFEPVDGVPLPEWTAGSHIDIDLPGVGVRQYSLSGRPGDPNYRITVLRETTGRGGSEFMHRTLRVGDELTARAPRNHFKVEPATSFTFIAGGIGITPLLTMLDAPEVAGAARRLHYFGRTRSSMAFHHQLAALGDEVRILADDEDHGATLDAIIAEAPTDGLIYVCGPTGLIDAVTAVAAAAGREDQVRFELFVAPAQAESRGDEGSFLVRFEASGIEAVVGPDQTILQVAGEHGIDVLHDCEEGICGSCETRVISGEVDHRDHVLTKQERERNDCMMVCVSRAACPVLVLDL